MAHYLELYLEWHAYTINDARKCSILVIKASMMNVVVMISNTIAFHMVNEPR